MPWHYSNRLIQDYENSLSLQEQEAASLGGSSSDGEPFAQSKSTTMPAVSSLPDKMTDASNPSPSGTMCEPSTASRGEELLTWFLADSRARTSALPLGLTAPELTENVVDCGERWSEWFAKWDRDSSSWKTPQTLLFKDLEESSPIFPQWGMMQNGACSGLVMLLGPMKEKERGLSLPTPTACDHKKVSRNPNFWRKRLEQGRSGMDTLPESAVTHWKGGDGAINPLLSEWLMDWPAGQTDLKPLATAKFRQWCDSHGVSSPPQKHEPAP